MHQHHKAKLAYKTFLSFSTQLSVKFILLNNVDILTFIGRRNTTCESFKVIKVLTFWYFNFYEQLKVHTQCS